MLLRNINRRYEMEGKQTFPVGKKADLFHLVKVYLQNKYLPKLSPQIQAFSVQPFSA